MLPDNWGSFGILFLDGSSFPQLCLRAPFRGRFGSPQSGRQQRRTLAPGAIPGLPPAAAPVPGHARRPCPQHGPPSSTAPGPGRWRGAAGRSGTGARIEIRVPDRSPGCSFGAKAAASCPQHPRAVASLGSRGRRIGSSSSRGLFLLVGSSINLSFSLPAPVVPVRSPGSSGWGRRSRLPGRGAGAAAFPFS